MSRYLFFFLVLLLMFSLVLADKPPNAPRDDELFAGFAETDITPSVKDKTVYMAGFGHNRRATGVHDPLKARAVVLRHGKEKIAIVAIDLIGLFHPRVESVRQRLKGFRHVLVSSTHNHEGPDTLGLWGASPFKSGVDADYLALVETRIVEAVQAADAEGKAVRAASAALAPGAAPRCPRTVYQARGADRSGVP